MEVTNRAIVWRLLVIGASFVHVKTISGDTYESEDSTGRTSPTKQAGILVDKKHGKGRESRDDSLT